MILLLTLTVKGFNPRSRTGSDVIGCSLESCIKEFQSTLPHGERQYLDIKKKIRNHVSIHAPARGATCRMNFASCFVVVSIHAPARGATDCNIIGQRFQIGFQSTLPHGERPAIVAQIDTVGLRFQSTLPHGERQRNPLLYTIDSQVSIHAPARGATVKTF